MKKITHPNNAAFSNALDDYGNPTLGFGLTKREYFAALAMQAVEFSNTGADINDFLSNNEIAERAVWLADALIEELNK
jgi:hypothetical protein